MLLWYEKKMIKIISWPFNFQNEPNDSWVEDAATNDE